MVRPVSCGVQRFKGSNPGKVLMSSVEEVRAAEKNVKEILEEISEALAKAPPSDPQHLTEKLRKASDEYARAVRALQARAE
jgi:hypothetical protein